MDKATQRSLILAYCATNGSITVREAFEGLNINSAWAMRERMEVKADAEDQLQAEGCEI